MDFINSLVFTIASSPYFIFITGCCSIISVITLGALWKTLFRITVKPDISKEYSTKIVDSLIDKLSTHPKMFMIYTLQGDNSIATMQGIPRNIDKLNSYGILTNTNDSIFYLFNDRKVIYLYAAVNLMQHDLKCIATSKENERVKELSTLLGADRCDSSDDFAKEIVQLLTHI